MQAADRIRNVALVGHRGSGKTSLHEALLHEAGATTRLGSVADGTTVSDSDDDEKARGMSISASLASFEWRDVKVNLIDTPGEPSFIADALGALRVCESAVFVVNRNLESPTSFTVDLSRLGEVTILETHTLTDEDIYATNSYEDPDRVRLVPNDSARIDDGRLTVGLPPVSWTAIALG